MPLVHSGLHLPLLVSVIARCTGAVAVAVHDADAAVKSGDVDDGLLAL